MDWWRIAGWVLVVLYSLALVTAPIGVGKVRKPRTEGEAALVIIAAGLHIWWTLVALGRGR